MRTLKERANNSTYRKRNATPPQQKRKEKIRNGSAVRKLYIQLLQRNKALRQAYLTPKRHKRLPPIAPAQGLHCFWCRRW